ncbi:MAG: alpha/beta hydrolase [Myxococcales bacterium]
MHDVQSSYLVRRPATSQFVEARGIRHHLTSWGSPALVSAERPPLVLVHGYMDVGASFQFLVDAMEQLEGASRYVLALDLRGYGRTQSPAAVDAYWFPDYLGDLDAVFRALFDDRPLDLLGHSMGGNICMVYAGVRPTRVRRLVNLEGFGLPESDPADAPDRYALWLEQLATEQTMPTFGDYEAVARRLCRNNPRLPPNKAAWLARQWAAGDDGQLKVLGDPAHKRVNPILYRMLEAQTCWARIQAPVLWVEGKQTEAERFWGGRYSLADFHRRLDVVTTPVQREALDDAGHMLHHDQPEKLAELVVRFLAAR